MGEFCKEEEKELAISSFFVVLNWLTPKPSRIRIETVKRPICALKLNMKANRPRNGKQTGLTTLHKKHQGRVAELETQVSQLEDALRTVKDQLIVSETWKKQAKINAEESRKELLAINLRLEESQQKLLVTSSSDEAHNMVEKLAIIEEMKNEIEDCRSSESRAQGLASETLLQLETAKKTMESLKLAGGEYNAIVSELEESRARVRSLELIIEEMKVKKQENESEEIAALKSELRNLKSRQRLEINDELLKSKVDVEELRANLMDKETELQCVLEENENLNAKLANL
ncbi:hypothetical protein L2E82_31969 [Cichorium intybus]|uniref:Uncharacterized protein n=1 Tax=Cichorium intybus TaxID=13427 RepID=A0ACB9BIX3_CICIN|nr:hypothetical protein L2E82_31969 [Cichorium intybus]